MKTDDTTGKPGEPTEAEIEDHRQWLNQHNIVFPPCQPSRATQITGAYQKPASEEDELHRRFCRQLQSLEPGAVLVAWPVRGGVPKLVR